MNKINIDIKSPWALLATLIMGAALITVVALADHDDDNYEKQKAAIDKANDGIVGYTHDGLPVYQSEVDEAEALAQLQLDRLLNIDIKGIQKVDTNVLNINTVELFVKDNVYTIIVDNCGLNEIDNFQWQTRGDGSLDIGDFAIVRRNPFKYFDNPNLELTKEQIEAKLKNWDIDQRACFIVAIQKAGKIEIKTPEVSSEAVRG